MEDAKTLFASLRDKARKAEFARMQLKELQTAAAKCTPVMHLAPSGGGGESRTLENNVIRIEEAERDLQKIVDDYEATRQQIQNLILALDDPLHQHVMQLRYIDGLTWEKIGNTVHVCQASIYKLNASALQSIDKILKNRECGRD